MRFNQATSGDTYRINSTTTYPSNGTTWMHVAATYDGTTIRLYVNGVQEGGNLAGPASIATNNLALGIGAQPDGASHAAGRDGRRPPLQHGARRLRDRGVGGDHAGEHAADPEPGRQQERPGRNPARLHRDRERSRRGRHADVLPRQRQRRVGARGRLDHERRRLHLDADRRPGGDRDLRRLRLATAPPRTARRSPSPSAQPGPTPCSSAPATSRVARARRTPTRQRSSPGFPATCSRSETTRTRPAPPPSSAATTTPGAPSRRARGRRPATTTTATAPRRARRPYFDYFNGVGQPDRAGRRSGSRLLQLQHRQRGEHVACGRAELRVRARHRVLAAGRLRRRLGAGSVAQERPRDRADEQHHRHLAQAALVVARETTRTCSSSGRTSTTAGPTSSSAATGTTTSVSRRWTASGASDPSFGVRQFVVGTGGAALTGFGTILPTSEVRNSSTYGVIKFTLHASSYDWQFIPISGQTFTDSGTAPVHAAPSSTPGTFTTIPVTDSTGEKPQSKLWQYNGTWWAVLPTTAVSPAGTWIWRLNNDDTWSNVLQISNNTNVQADAKAVWRSDPHPAPRPVPSSSRCSTSRPATRMSRGRAGPRRRRSRFPTARSRRSISTPPAACGSRPRTSRTSTSTTATRPTRSFTGPITPCEQHQRRRHRGRHGVCRTARSVSCGRTRTPSDSASRCMSTASRQATWSADEVPASGSALPVGAGHGRRPPQRRRRLQRNPVCRREDELRHGRAIRRSPC